MNLRISTAAMAVLFAVSPAHADPRAHVVAALAKCVDIGDDHARLVCYDQLSTELKSAAAQPPAAPIAAQAPAAAPGEGKSWLDVGNIFGSDGGAGPAQSSDEGWLGVAGYDVAPSGGFVVTLDNGQVWREVERDYSHPPFKKDAKNMVTISRAMLGGYNLQLKGFPALYKVKRSQ